MFDTLALERDQLFIAKNDASHHERPRGPPQANEIRMAPWATSTINRDAET